MNKEIIEDISKETLKEIEEYGYLPYPYYYTKIFNSQIAELKGTDVSEKLLLKAYLDESQLNKSKSIIQKFGQSNEKISKVSNNFFTEIKSENRVDNVKNIIGKFEDELLSELQQSNEEVDHLKKELELAYRQLKIDPLTKTFNRGALDNDLNRILSFGKEKDLELFLILIDIDDFKSINDNYGHIVGDKILIASSNIFKNSIRNQDKVYRYGGDEFVIVLNRSTENMTKITAKRILDKIFHSIFKINDSNIKITVSIGITGHKKGDGIENLIERADEALYKTKQSGKNSINLK